MKRTLLALAAAAVMPFAAAQELATYTITTGIEGMTIDGQPPGAGDRVLNYTLYIDPTDADAANEMYYAHLELLLGPDTIAALRAEARALSGGRR